MKKNKQTNVAIVEDNHALGESLRQIVESSPDYKCIGVWRSGEEGLPKIDAFRPDVILMDINLPGMSGIDATARIKDFLPDIQIIMVTVYRDLDKIFEALKAGASGYLLKRSTPAEVRAAIADVRSGGAPMSAQIARRVVEAFHRPKAKQENTVTELSPRETEILEQLCQGLVNKEIADKLGIATETVKVHLKHIY